MLYCVIPRCTVFYHAVLHSTKLYCILPTRQGPNKHTPPLLVTVLGNYCMTLAKAHPTKTRVPSPISILCRCSPVPPKGNSSDMENVWHLRKVADTAAKACWICYKPASSVLITPDSKDYFYICPSHLKDRQFAVPTDDEAAALAEAKKKEDLDREIEKIKAEYEDKMKRKREKKDKKDKTDNNKKDAKDDKPDDKISTDADTDARDAKERDDKIKAVTSKQQDVKTDLGPRVFRLQK